MELQSSIIPLSKEYNIITPFTSFIAVEEREVNNKDCSPKWLAVDKGSIIMMQRNDALIINCFS